MIFAARLPQLRVQKALPLYELAERSGLNVTYLSQIERGHAIPSCETLERLAEALGVPLYQLFYDEAPPPTPWLTPRPTLEELMKSRLEPESDEGMGVLNRVKMFCHELGSLLR